MENGKWILIFFLFSPLFGVDNQKLIDCYEIFDQKRAELEAEAEKILEEREAFEALKNTYMALMKKKEEKLKQKEKELNATLEKIELVKENKKILEEIKKAKLDKVTQSYAKMRPKNAASILSNMNIKDALNILQKLPPKTLAKIFAKMDAAKAAKFTELLQKVEINESTNSP